MLTQEEVEHIALLARVGIMENEKGKYQKNLSLVLDFFHELETVDTDAVEPIGHITGSENRARTDMFVGVAEEEKQGIRDNMPEMQDGFVKVKSVF
ncbi:MAG: Asp-tRNA(Asn)/Glu-tRNA(Gln) amidotransferase subunit GatC [Candidatus Moranbacteria bacterium]|nr:Asp-tRNA(Asn)/Glu-tRNA(Gln) amidotransferase subunit GatC [Candidatus Moranbacteria bacterium]OIQ02429.1 MAG: hypothetical protein AUK58_03125 [Candidatus Moranbacteria bacterium CG2_30_41_165]PIP25445.1 MAG: Asp-tRNA(Asn)/Glu-tRNA(Gln) amidotransferase GatCAB subunit C [Candidatus Moranbacteria bacterium CG23_combo_of_CG06-09_8_20_14_all_41_28]PIV86181.1 MAG: Asp-tRNA(Asn)/Glu-tRNA(Gln) amidotransferase GatCAB subunit C [Candidatus Moranbacteria bacterium CG17_big_fil_post_rev_8_21_14_2_50_4